MLHKIKKIIKKILKIIGILVFWYFAPKVLFLIIRNPNLFLLISVQILALIIAVLVFYFNEAKEWILKNKDMISVLAIISVLVTLTIFFFNVRERSIDEYNKRYNAESALGAENIINYKILDDILQGEGEDWLYWEYFSIIGYRQNWGYIAQNYSQDCAMAYLKMVHNMEVINNMTEAINDSVIRQIDTGNLEEKRIKNASSTKETLDYIFNSCR